MPLFSDMRGRFFALPDEVLEQYRLPDVAEGAADDAAADSPASAPSPAAPASPATAGTTVIIINAAGAAERGGADA
uniref:Uncharacterized protein n=1 Tax=uncultured bacterium esnapd22 TaxID=1366604 RepID=S5UDA5_9BACT|nr:hypothetical protein [uncultured bacterium esnapd22]